jgi:hypothetical protein
VTKTKSCPACGAAFSCCGEGCWCAGLPTLETVSQASDCFCPNCLGAKLDAEHEAKRS